MMPMPPSMSIIHPATRYPYLSTMNGGRACFALAHHDPFAVRVADLATVSYGARLAIVMSVDGRNVIDNTPASKNGQAYIVRGSDDHVCLGFRTSEAGVREFVFMPAGTGTVAEHNGTSESHGLISVVIYNEATPEPRRNVDFVPAAHRSSGDGPVMRGGGMTHDSHTLGRGASGGAGAGREVASRVSTTSFVRQTIVHSSIIEYDTRESWARRGVYFMRDTHDAWPGDVQQFSRNLDAPPR